MPIRASFVVAVLLLAVTAHAEPQRPASATDELRRRFDHALAVVQTSSFRALEPERQRGELRRAISGVFNWPEIARRSLGARQWSALSAGERREFTDSFMTLAERAYMGPLERMAARGVPMTEPVRFLSEAREGSETVVRTALAYPRELPVDFVMVERTGRWQICDVRVDQVSATENYSAQLRRVTAPK